MVISLVFVLSPVVCIMHSAKCKMHNAQCKMHNAVYGSPNEGGEQNSMQSARLKEQLGK